jgi:hypothetical protein
MHELVPAGPLRELIAALLEAAAEDRSVPIEELAARLGAEEARLLRQLSVSDDEAIDATVAARTIDDTIQWLRKERERERRERSPNGYAIRTRTYRPFSRKKTASRNNGSRLLTTHSRE